MSAAALGLIWFPVGTAVGALIISYMLCDEAKETFGAVPPPISDAPPTEIRQKLLDAQTSPVA